MIEIRNISFGYDGNGGAVLGGIDLEIRKGEYIAVIGPNGSGKTTLLKHLNGLLVPRTGEVLVNGRSTRDLDSLREIRQKVGMIFQNPDNQLVGMSVEEDVAFGPGNLRLKPEEIRSRVDEALQTIGIKALAQRAPHTLSSGEKQLTAIAGVLAMDPEYILLDEPTTYLDPQGRKRVLHVVRKLHKGGITIVHVTHDLDEVAAADRVVVMERGGIAVSGKPAEVFSCRDLMDRLGLGVPRIMELAAMLNRMGVKVRPDSLSLEEVSRAILDNLDHEIKG